MSGPYDFRAEFWDAMNASPLSTRRINGEPHDADDLPDKDES